MRIRKSFKRIFRFSLRTFLIAVTIFSLWMGMRVQQAREQKAAVEAILAVNGRVRYDAEIGETYWNRPSVRTYQEERFSIPSKWSLTLRQWLRPYLGQHLLDRVVIVQLGPRSWPALRDEFNQQVQEGEQLGNPPLFSEFMLNRLSPSDQMWQTLLKLESLEYLSVVCDDEDMRYISQFPKLRTLRVTGRITETGMTHLAARPVEYCEIRSFEELAKRQQRIIEHFLEKRDRNVR